MGREKPSLLETIGLTVGYDEKTLFENLDLSLKAGELVCFMGPNGAGKSTLIRTLAGVIKPIGGTMVFNSPSLLRERFISVVLTDPIKSSYMTVRELVIFGRYPYLSWQLKLTQADEKLVDGAIEMVNIGHLQHRTLDKLSDGQKQMAMIARALAQDTPIILLDEPTAHLDLNNRVEVMRLLKELTRTAGKSILLSTHELDLALQTADLVWLAGHDKKVTDGIPEDLVLQGVFDDIFQFKGFDLKTGKVQHKAFRSSVIRLSGDGHAYLWTKNLMERNGFVVSPSNGPITVDVKSSESGIEWTVGERARFTSLKDLLQYLESRDETNNRTTND